MPLNSACSMMLLQVVMNAGWNKQRRLAFGPVSYCILWLILLAMVTSYISTNDSYMRDDDVSMHIMVTSSASTHLRIQWTGLVGMIVAALAEHRTKTRSGRGRQG